MVLAAGMIYLGFSCGCNIYRFNEATIPDSIRTINVKFVENRARIVNTQLSPRLTDRLRQKITAQTRLTQTNSETADWEVSSFVTDYSLSTSGISNQTAVQNRLSVAVHVSVYDRKADETKEHDVSRSFEFKGNLSLQQAENQLMDEMVRTLTDEIFNKLFSNW
jgi:Lipopolysaccharide-assembly